MAASTFAADLALYGPEAARRRAATLTEGREYCQRLAATHYENFSVATRLLPRELRPHFCHVYAYCRWADDLADEVDDPERSLRLLDWWEAQLDACYRDEATHPVFVALRETVREFAIPVRPFRDLLSAFRQDQRVSRYESFAELLEYCRCSANPVGRIVLHLARCCDDARAELADRVCTGLQLANFWQDVAGDYRRGRVYLPQEDCRRFGYGEEDLAAGRCNAAFRQLLAFEVDRAERCLREGAPLVERMPPAVQGDVWLFIQGGLGICRRIRQAEYDVWSRRPTLSRWEKLRLVAGSAMRNVAQRWRRRR